MNFTSGPKAVLLTTTAALTLSGCAFGVRPTETPKPKRYPPASLTKDCGPLGDPMSGRMTDLAKDHKDTAKKYHLCREQLQDLVKWWEQSRD